MLIQEKMHKMHWYVYTCKVKDHESSVEQTSPIENKETLESYFFNMMQTHQDAIFRFLYFRVTNRSVALDITQDTFTKTWVYLSSGKTIEHEEAFLYRTAKNALIDYFKKAKSSSLDALMDSGYDPGSSKDIDTLFKQDDIDTIRKLLDKLDEESKHIIFLRYVEERSIEEIANQYGKSVNAMTVHIHRIIKKLRGRYNEIQ
jgi:RNA polymerase sigma-70 factor, ECF subfamily